MARKFEAATAAQAQTMLDTILGPGKSVVRVSAQMDTNQVESKATRYDKDNAVVVASKKAGETFQGPSATIPAGVVGVTGSTLVTAASQDQRYEKTDQVDSVAVGATETLTKQSPGTLQRLSVAVAVDQATLDQLGIDQQGMADLRQLVIAAVGAQVDDVDPAASRDTVELRAQTFDTTGIEAGDKALEAVASAQSKDAMIRYAKTGGALLVLLLAVLFLRKGLKGRKDEVAEIDQATLARTAEPFGVLRAADEAPATDQVQALLATVTDDGDDRRALDPASEVLDLIDREPEDVAALLRSWVADRRS
jgi:flagellar M-ring protein FliF